MNTHSKMIPTFPYKRLANVVAYNLGDLFFYYFVNGYFKYTFSGLFFVQVFPKIVYKVHQLYLFFNGQF